MFKILYVQQMKHDGHLNTKPPSREQDITTDKKDLKDVKDQFKSRPVSVHSHGICTYRMHQHLGILKTIKHILFQMQRQTLFKGAATLSYEAKNNNKERQKLNKTKQI